MAKVGWIISKRNSLFLSFSPPPHPHPAPLSLFFLIKFRTFWYSELQQIVLLSLCKYASHQYNRTEESIVSGAVAAAAARVVVAVAWVIVASADYTWRPALVGTAKPGLHTAWPRLTGFCVGKFALNDAGACTRNTRAGQRAFSARADGCIVYTLRNARNLFLSRVHVRACKRTSE